MRTQLPVALLAAFFVWSMHAYPAQALATRAWVSGAGVDQAGCGTFASPCRTPQYAHDNIVSAGGEIDFLDPAGYGAITITKAISLVNDGVGTTGMLASAAGNAITINAGSNDAVQLRGLTIEGSGIGYNGIVFNSGGSLTVTNCVAQNFVKDLGGDPTTGNGILIQPTAGAINFLITNTIISNNQYGGIFYLPPSGGAPSTNGVVDHVVATANLYGFAVNTFPATNAVTVATVSNSILSNNNTGVFVENGTGALKLSIDNASISSNSGYGIQAYNTSNVLLGRSVITANSVGVYNATASNTFYTYGNNQINLNGVGEDISGTALNTTFAPR